MCPGPQHHHHRRSLPHLHGPGAYNSTLPHKSSSSRGPGAEIPHMGGHMAATPASLSPVAVRTGSMASVKVKIKKHVKETVPLR